MAMGERVYAGCACVEGGSGQEQALLVRLHLLQGVLSYHRGDGGGRATHYLDMVRGTPPTLTQQTPASPLVFNSML